MKKLLLGTVLLMLSFSSSYAKWPEMGVVVFVGEVIVKPVILPNGIQTIKLQNFADCGMVEVGSEYQYKVKKGDAVVVYGLSGGPVVEILSLSVVTPTVKAGDKYMNSHAQRFVGYREFQSGKCGHKIPSLSS